MASYNSFKRINSDAIIDNAVSSIDFANGAVTTAKIADGAVETGDISNQAVDTNKLGGTVDLSTKTITYRPFLDGDFSSGAIPGGKLATGAATDNLGYTPLNKLGDTIQGTLILQNGSVMSPDGANTSGIRIDGQDIQIRTSGTSRLQFDSSGRPLERNRPVWACSGRGGWRYANSYGGPGGWRELGHGWNFSTQGISTTNGTNARVYAPVSGYYYVYSQGYMYNDSNSTNGYTHWNVGRNSSPSTSTTGRTPHTMYAYGTRNNYAAGIMAGITIFMNSGQYVSPQPYFGGNQGRIHGNHGFFAGYMVG